MNAVVPPPLFVSLGDPAGIGCEIYLRALAARPHLVDRVRAFGDRAALERAAALTDLPIVGEVVAAPQSGPAAALWALEEVVAAATRHPGAAIVTAPVTKADLVAAGFEFFGQTEFLGARLGAHPTMMLAGDELRVALVTTHLPLRQVASAVTFEQVLRTIEATHRGLTSWFGIAAPRLAVLGLNPHAGEDGVLGAEDAAVIRPAVQRAREQGIDAVGPLPADAAFAPRARRRYDAHVAMFHDQGLTALKAIEGGRAVNLTLGLPLPRTSPDHGSARDIAGQGTADPTSMIAALDLAERVAGTTKHWHVVRPRS